MKKEHCPKCGKVVRYDKCFRAICICGWRDERARTMLAVNIDKREADPADQIDWRG